MKIGIVTVYNSMNYGAFLQAYAMKTCLESQNHTVFFIKHHIRKPFLYSIAETGYKLLFAKQKYREVSYIWHKYQNYVKNQSLFPLCRINSKTFKELDVILFGSDEIWNVQRKQISKYNMLFGHGFDSHVKIAFAPSINNSRKEDFEKFPHLIKDLKSFRHIAVRGQNSQKVIEEILGRKIEEVLDPTLLIESDQYQPIEKLYKNEHYILVYAYRNTVEENIVEKLTQYSRNRGYRLISVLSYLPWCDENPSLSAGELIHCFKKADFVFTSTFHGVALSLAFQKQFISVVEDKQIKINELLKKFKLENRIVKNEDDLETLINTLVDYNLLNNDLEKERKHCRKIMDGFLQL